MLPSNERSGCRALYFYSAQSAGSPTPAEGVCTQRPTLLLQVSWLSLLVPDTNVEKQVRQ